MGGLLSDQPSIFEMQDPVAARKNPGVVRDHDHGPTMVMSQTLQEFDNGSAT
jgi:hypothetical protein